MGIITVGLRSNPIVENTIISFNHNGPALAWDSIQPGVPTLTCCDLYENAGGDWVDFVAAQYGINGNFSADPVFCGRSTGNLMLSAVSPCVPGNHPDGADCGLIGALGVGCGPTAVHNTTWGRVKSMFR
jgi:hypothetical protein